MTKKKESYNYYKQIIENYNNVPIWNDSHFKKEVIFN